MVQPRIVVEKTREKVRRRRGRTRLPPLIRLKALCVLAAFAGCVEKLIAEEHITRSGLAAGMRVDRKQAYLWGKGLSLPREPGAVIELLMLRGCITVGPKLYAHLPRAYQQLWDSFTDGGEPTDELGLLTEIASESVNPSLLAKMAKLILKQEKEVRR